ncbi:TetR/AcrR family transcriptional regulator [uncultured Mycolicibacterium sp.]|uniref:TetR/AcrR family transcriptional regulator n=1 Tax=uncultured Mycolicibacterium sp. TaxID=2320817 RepID=UPI0026279248|nr:TetR/AcrR family transcriptional regulator [uncultured Mycolicibacterium sp.]
MPRIDDRILDAATDCLLAYGADRVTLAEIARRAGVSRPTIYRRWPDVRAVLATLLTRRITDALDAVPGPGVGRAALVARIVALADRLRADEVITTVLRTRPDLAMVYIAERLGTSQQILVDAVAGDIELAQQDGSVRPGDPRRLAAMCLLITQSAIQSARMVEPILDAEALDAELTRALDGYLKP